nr:molybdenum cofactor sulfurase [Tanacetum cinerariifolium]
MANYGLKLTIFFLFIITYEYWSTHVKPSNLTSTFGGSNHLSHVVKDVFILAGQSNMAGRGGVINGMAFANAMLRNDPRRSRVIGLVPCAIGGSGIDEWSRDKRLYKRLVNRAKVAVKSGGEIRAVLWFQGERDTINITDAESYKGKLQKLFIDLRYDLKSPLLPVIQMKRRWTQFPPLLPESPTYYYQVSNEEEDGDKDERTEKLLAMVDQSPNSLMQEAVDQPTKALFNESLLKHSSMDLRASVTSCLGEITRITAPYALYVDEEMKEYLNNIYSPMVNIMARVLEESEEISVDMIKPILATLRKSSDGVLPVARKLREEALSDNEDERTDSDDIPLKAAAKKGTVEYDIKARIMDYLNIPESKYGPVFTVSRGSTFKLLAESYPFNTNKSLLTMFDHESQSVNSMGQCAKQKGAKWKKNRVLFTTLIMKKKKRKKDLSKGLFVFPVQSRVTGAKYSYQWMPFAQQNNWHDAEALGPLDMDSLGLSLFHEKEEIGLLETRSNNVSDQEIYFFIIAVQTPGSRISILLAVETPSTGSGNLYCQWELFPGIDLTGDEDPSDEDEESNIGESDNTRDGGKIADRAITTWGGGMASYACMTSIFESSCKGEKTSMSKRYLVNHLKSQEKCFPMRLRNSSECSWRKKYSQYQNRMGR